MSTEDGVRRVDALIAERDRLRQVEIAARALVATWNNLSGVMTAYQGLRAALLVPSARSGEPVDLAPFAREAAAAWTGEHGTAVGARATVARCSPRLAEALRVLSAAVAGGA